MEQLYTMDYMEQSTIHIKAPHEVHIAAKVKAAKRRTSMNQYVIDLIKADVGEKELEIVEPSIIAFHKATPKQKKTIIKAEKIMGELLEIPGVQRASEIEKCPGEHTVRMDCGREGCPYA